MHMDGKQIWAEAKRGVVVYAACTATNDTMNQLTNQGSRPDDIATGVIVAVFRPPRPTRSSSMLLFS